MFIVSLLTFLYGFVCVLTVILVLIQRSKGSMGLGNMGGGNQALFGSSGGQDIFQKITWTCLVILLAGSMLLSVAKVKYGTGSLSSFVPKHSAQSNSSSE